MKGSSRKDSPYVRKIPGAMASTWSVGTMNKVIKGWGKRRRTTVHPTPKAAAVYRAYRSTPRIRAPCRAPWFWERMGWAGLAHAVAAALDQGAHVHQHPVDRQGVAPQPGHDLPVEEDGEDAHGDVHEKGGEPRDPDLPHGGKHGPPPTRRRVFLRERKWVAMRRTAIPAPRQVAMPAPRMPRSATNTR